MNLQEWICSYTIFEFSHLLKIGKLKDEIEKTNFIKPQRDLCQIIVAQLYWRNYNPIVFLFVAFWRMSPKMPQISNLKNITSTWRQKQKWNDVLVVVFRTRWASGVPGSMQTVTVEQVAGSSHFSLSTPCKVRQCRTDVVCRKTVFLKGGAAKTYWAAFVYHLNSSRCHSIFDAQPGNNDMLEGHPCCVVSMSATSSLRRWRSHAGWPVVQHKGRVIFFLMKPRWWPSKNQ